MKLRAQTKAWESSAGHALSENDATHRWLDCLMHDGDPKDFMAAPIRIFVMDRWRDEAEWPLSRAHNVEYYLHTCEGLSEAPPRENESEDHYSYDPDDPVPTLGGNRSVGQYNPGLYDQRIVEERRDVLTYTSEMLERDTEVTGPAAVVLFASSSARPSHIVLPIVD